MYNFYIDTTSATFIEFGQYNSYTFPILKDINTPNIIKNLMLSLRADGSYKAFLMTYTLTLDEQEQHLNGQYVDLDGKIEVQSLDYDFIALTNANNRNVELGNGLWYNDDLNYCYKIEPVFDSATGWLIENAQTDVSCPWEDDSADTITDIPGGGGNSDTNNNNNNSNNNPPDDANSGGGNSNNGGSTSSNDNSSDSDNNENNTGNNVDPLENCILIDGECVPDATLVMDTPLCRPNLDLQLLINELPEGDFKSQVNAFLTSNSCDDSALEFLSLAIEAFEDGGEVDFEDQVINKLTGKAKCVYNKLKSSSTGFKNTIKKFEPDFPVAHLKFEESDLPDNTRGETSPPENFLITITLNNDNSNSGYDFRPNLLTAKTIIHEVIHAEMFRKMLELANNNGSIDVALLNLMLSNGDYPGMLDYYTRYGLNGFQHQQMATHYKETIGRVLQEFDTGTTVADNQQPLQIYLDLAWEGLNHSNITEWEELTTQEEKDRIDQVIADYINNNTNESCNE